MKDMLAKKFKREKAMAAARKDENEYRAQLLLDKNEKAKDHKARKHTQDAKIDQEKQREFKKTMKKMQLTSQRRLEILNERSRGAK